MDMNYAIGAGAALGSAASWALGAILFKKLGESLSSLAMTLVKGAASLLLLGLALLAVRAGIVPGIQWEIIGNKDLALLALSGVLGIAVGDTLFFEALQELGPHLLVVLILLGQVLTVVLAVIFFKWFKLVQKREIGIVTICTNSISLNHVLCAQYYKSKAPVSGFTKVRPGLSQDTPLIF